MKTLIVYYSRTGTTKKAAEAIAKTLKAGIEEIVDMKKRSGWQNYLSSGRDALRKKLTEIRPIKNNPKNYDMIILGTPIWAGRMAPAVRTYISQNKKAFKRVAFFCTMGGSGDKSAFKDMQESAGKKPEATLTLMTKEVANNDFSEKLGRFRSQILAKGKN
jgi:flavodoxin